MQNKLKYYRERKGLSREELADRVGLPVETIASIEAGIQTIISTRSAAKIAMVLEQQPSEIFTDFPWYEGPSEEERRAMYEAAVALHRAKDAIGALISRPDFVAAEENDPKIREAEEQLTVALDAAGISEDARERILEASVDVAMTYRNLALVLGLEIGFGLIQQKTAPKPYDPFGYNR